MFTLDDRTQGAAIEQAQGVIAKDQALVGQARATLAKDLGQVEQARATLAKDLGQVEQARATLAKDQAMVRQAHATLAKDEAQADYAQAQNKRYGDLYNEGEISQDTAQQYATNYRSSQATLQVDQEAIANAEQVVKGDQVAIDNAQQVVKGDQVAIDNAQQVVKGDQEAIKNAEAVVSSDQAALKSVQVQLSYSKIYAPIDGLAGNVLVTEGNVVQANSTTPLVTITQIHPIQVSFSIPESNLPAVQKRLQNGRLKVDVTFPDSTQSIPGTLTFVNNTVDPTTGTIQLIGDFDNTQGKLFPGQFVNTTLTLAEEPDAIVVPDQSVQNGPNGQFVFVVKPDMTVENVPVVVSNSVDGLDVVQKGLQPGDQVVTDGQANLVSGSSISIKTGAGAADSDDSTSSVRINTGKNSAKDNTPNSAGNNDKDSKEKAGKQNDPGNNKVSGNDANPSGNQTWKSGRKRKAKEDQSSPSTGGN